MPLTLVTPPTLVPVSLADAKVHLRVGGAWSMTVDGALLDATVANHAAGASFYNSAAGFGAGVGAYVRGAA